MSSIVDGVKKLVLIRGPICSGKSTVAKLLSERIKNCTLLDEDVFKRMIDRAEATRWRSRLAFGAALFVAEGLMKKGRTIIADIHSSKKDRYVEYKKLAKRHGYALHSFLLRPPLAVCQERNRLRDIPDVLYKISATDIEKYWKRLHKVAGEKVFTEPDITPARLAGDILEDVDVNACNIPYFTSIFR